MQISKLKTPRLLRLAVLLSVILTLDTGKAASTFDTSARLSFTYSDQLKRPQRGIDSQTSDSHYRSLGLSHQEIMLRYHQKHTMLELRLLPHLVNSGSSFDSRAGQVLYAYQEKFLDSYKVLYKLDADKGLALGVFKAMYRDSRFWITELDFALEVLAPQHFWAMQLQTNSKLPILNVDSQIDAYIYQGRDSRHEDLSYGNSFDKAPSTAEPYWGGAIVTHVPLSQSLSRILIGAGQNRQKTRKSSEVYLDCLHSHHLTIKDFSLRMQMQLAFNHESYYQGSGIKRRWQRSGAISAVAPIAFDMHSFAKLSYGVNEHLDDSASSAHIITYRGYQYQIGVKKIWDKALHFESAFAFEERIAEQHGHKEAGIWQVGSDSGAVRTLSRILFGIHYVI